MAGGPLVMIVMKFGGTSVADRAAIERLIAIIRAAKLISSRFNRFG